MKIVKQLACMLKMDAKFKKSSNRKDTVATGCILPDMLYLKARRKLMTKIEVSIFMKVEIEKS